MVRALSKTGLPALVATTTLEASKTLKRYFTGEIDGTECLEELGEKGAGMVSSAMFMAIGQAAIPIPIVGALAGSMVGYAFSAASYKVLTDSLKEAKLSRERRTAIERECEESIRMMREYRAELTAVLDRHLARRKALFDEAFAKVEEAIKTNDASGYIGAMNDIAAAHGRKPQFHDTAECDDLMSSCKAVVI